MSRRLRHLGFGLVLALTVCMVLWKDPPPESVEFAASELPAPAIESEPKMVRGYVTPPGLTASTHAGCLTELSDGSVLAAWFGGSREGAKDVAIYQATFNPSLGQWSDALVLTDRLQTQGELGRYIRKLGNPVLMRDGQGRIWLFYVNVSLGGWATSAVSYKIAGDKGQTWSRARRLVTSPFANISTLVKGRPLMYRDGTIGLPAYHELLGKFGELLHVSPNGQLLGKTRITDGRRAIQPWLMATDATVVQALMRRVGSAPPRVLATGSEDGGRRWGALQASSLPNPNAAVAAALRPDGSKLIVFNDSETARNNLSMALSREGGRWQRLIVLEQGISPREYSYPYLIRTSAGEYHLIYTWRRERMAHVAFNDAWIESLR